jgi:hypothetical protein
MELTFDAHLPPLGDFGVVSRGERGKPRPNHTMAVLASAGMSYRAT